MPTLEWKSVTNPTYESVRQLLLVEAQTGVHVTFKDETGGRHRSTYGIFGFLMPGDAHFAPMLGLNLGMRFEACMIPLSDIKELRIVTLLEMVAELNARPAQPES